MIFDCCIQHNVVRNFIEYFVVTATIMFLHSCTNTMSDRIATFSASLAAAALIVIYFYARPQTA